MNFNIDLFVQNTLPLLLAIGGLIAWGWKRLDRKFDKIDEAFGRIEHKIDTMALKLETMNDRLTRLEVRVEERTLRVIHTSSEKVQNVLGQ